MSAQVAMVWCGLWLWGCSVSGRDLSGAEPDAGGPQRRGTPACQRWQLAFCDYVADRCPRLARSVCDRQNEGVECRDDEIADRCADAFDDATCSSPPPGCEVIDVADGAAAAVRCETYYHALCESNVRCGFFDNIDECRAFPQFAFDCDRALSIGLAFDDCLHELSVRSCDRGAPICDEVVRAR